MSKNRNQKPGPGRKRTTKTTTFETLLQSDIPSLQTARLLWQHNRFEKSLELFRDTVAAHPNNLIALIDAARAHGHHHEIAVAEEWLDRAYQLQGRLVPPGDLQILHLIAQSYRMIFRPFKAKAIFEEICRRTDRVPDALLELAMIRERGHQLIEAAELLDRLLFAHADYWPAVLMRARVHRRQQELTQATRAFESLTKSSNVPPSILAEAWAEMALMADEAGDFPYALLLMERCKNIQLEFAANVFEQSQKLLNEFGQLRLSLRGGAVSRWQQEAQRATTAPDRRLAVLTGFPRSGTTLLEKNLAKHPDLLDAEELEIFGREIVPKMNLGGNGQLRSNSLDGLDVAQASVLRQEYWRLSEAYHGQPIGDRVNLDKNPSLLILLPAVVRLFPQVKVLFAIRDPRDVVISCFMRYLPLNSNSVWFLSLKRTVDRLTHDLKYWLQIRQELESQSMEVRYEDTVLDLRQQTDRCLDFLELPKAKIGPEPIGRIDKLVTSPSYEAVNRPVYTNRVARWANYSQFLAPFLGKLEPLLDDWGYR